MPLTSLLLLLATQGAREVPSSSSLPAIDLSAVERPFVAQKKWALCIGAGAYTSDLAPLRFAADDARTFARTLVNGYGFEPSTVSLLADGTAKEAPVAPEKPPTAEEILGETRRLIADRRLDRGDLFIFYFSGHGVGTASGDYLMPTDVPESEAAQKGVAVRELIGSFVKAGLKNVLVVADACRSGQKNPFGAELQELGRKSNVAVLLGCEPGQRSYEVPRLGHGVFTHFLVKDMADRSLTDGSSGALWASSVAKKVSAQVQEYSEVDHPDDPQIPAVWSEPSQDVLLAAYPPKEGEFATALKAQGGKLDPNVYARYLSGIGESLRDADRNSEAIQAFKTLDGLGLATWGDLSSLAVSLADEKRENEIGSLVSRAIAEPSPTDFSELVILSGKPGFVGADRFRRAARTLARPETYGFRGVSFLISLERVSLGLDEAEIARDIAPFLTRYSKESMEGRYLAANVAFGERRYADAIRLAESASRMAGVEPIDRRSLRLVRYRAATALGQKANAAVIIAEGEADPTDASTWIGTRLQLQKNAKDPGFLKAAKAVAATTHSEIEIGKLLVLLGVDAGEILPDAERVQREHPYAWQPYVDVWVAQAAKNGLFAVVDLPDEAFKYAPVKSDLIRFALDRWDDVLETGRIDQRADGIQVAFAREELVGWYAHYFDDIQDDPDALFGMSRTFMRSKQTVRGALLARLFLWPYAQKTAYARAELTQTSLFLALNNADESTAKAAFAAIETAGQLTPRTIVRYAVHQALANNEGEAERAMGLWPKLGQGPPSGPVAGDFNAIRGLLAERRGDKEKAKEFLIPVKDLTHEAEFPFYIAQYEIVPSDEILERLSDMVFDHDGELSDQQVAALVSIIRDLSARQEHLPTLAIFSGLLASFPGHPWAQKIGFRGVKGVANWAGETRWTVRDSDGLASEHGTMTLRVDAAGHATGELAIEERPLQRIEGIVDEFGNFQGRRNSEKGEPISVLLMKLPDMASATMQDVLESSFSGAWIKSESYGGTLRISLTGATPLPSSAPAQGRRG